MLRIKAMTSLIPIHLYLQIISRCHQLQTFTLSSNHTIKFLLEIRHTNNTSPHYLLLENITSKQRQKIKSPIIDTNNHLNGIFSSFDSVNNRFSSGFKLLIFFLVIFSFIKQTTKTKKAKLLISKHSTN